MLIESLRLDGLLSFAPGSESIELRDLNLIIGPNGSGKSNLLEAVELLRAIPTGFASAIREGGGVREWLWKGDGAGPASIDARIARKPFTALRYCLSFAASAQRSEIVGETIEAAEKDNPAILDLSSYYSFNGGNPIITVREAATKVRAQRPLVRESLASDESILSQRKDPDLYPELTWCASQFARIQMFREWSMGRYAPLRQPQPADLPSDTLLPDARNLGLILNQIEHSDAGPEFNRLLKQFLPRYRRLSTLVQGGTVQFYLHEEGLKAPIAATRLSDGTIRFLAMLALLLMPNPPPLYAWRNPSLAYTPMLFPSWPSFLSKPEAECN